MRRLRILVSLLLVSMVALSLSAQADKKGKLKEKPAEEQKVRPPGIWISDTGNGRIVYMEDMTGKGFTTLGYAGFGLGRFLEPGQVWVDEQGRIYIADAGNNRVVRVDEMTGRGWVEMGGFNHPGGVCVKGDNVYIADTDNDQILLYDKWDGKLLFTIKHPEMTQPHQLWLDFRGDLYATCGEDPPGGKVVHIRQSEDVFYVHVYRGQGLRTASVAPGQVVTERRQIYFVDASFHRLITIQDIEGKGAREEGGYGVDPTQLQRPQGLGIDEEGHLYVADSGNDRLIRYDAFRPRELLVFSSTDDPDSQLRNPTSVFVWCPVPPPAPAEEEDTDK
ncbi:MAG: NHL repeat-containing protein [Candidatus Eremiobacteraeota bacterium]|nr:NHL repeat-containing protein [Candidatus Eremiobacteraeota bacterium]